MEAQGQNVIVSDRMMPFMNGVAFGNVVRSKPEHEKVHFIRMSGALERHWLDTANDDAFLHQLFPFELRADLPERLVTGPPKAAPV